MQGSTIRESETWPMQGSIPGNRRHGKCREVATFQGKGAMVNSGQHVPGKGRHGKCR